MKIIHKIRLSYTILPLIIIFMGIKLFPFNGNFIGGFDVADYFFWQFHFIKEQFLSGSMPLWNPYYYCGHPFLANPVHTVLYPPSLLFVLLPLPWAFNLDILLHLYLAAMGMFCFVYILTESESAGLAAAVVYSLSGYFMDRIFSGHFGMYHTPAFLPWIFFFIEKGFRNKRPVFFIISGLILGLQILAGYPQGSCYAALFLTVYFIIRYFSTVQPLRIENFFRFGRYYFLIPVIALGVSAVQILPSLEFKYLSDRADNTFEFATFMSFPPQNFFTFLVPVPASSPHVLSADVEFGGYIGILAIFLAGVGAMLSKHRKYTLCFGVLIFIAVSIMLGHYTPIYRLYYEYLPLFSTFRIPARCMIILVFSLVALVGFGIHFLTDESQVTKRQYAVMMTWGASLLLCLFCGAIFFEIPLANKDMLVAFGMAISFLGILTLTRFQKNRQILVSVIVVLLFTDLYLAYSPRIPVLNQDSLNKRLSYEYIFNQDPGYYRVNMPFDTLRGIRFNYYGANGYTTLVLNDYFNFVYKMAGLPKPTLRRHIFSPQLFQPNSVFSSKILGIKYARAMTQSGYRMFVSSKVMPRAVLVRDAIVLPHENQIEHIKRPDFDPEKTVLLESALENHELPGLKEGNISTAGDVVSIVNYQPNRIELKSDSETNTFLVLSELFYPGWRAYVDGEEVSILRANFILRAIPLKSGSHEIAFVFKPLSFYIGTAISISTLLILGAIYLTYLRKKGRKEAQ